MLILMSVSVELGHRIKAVRCKHNASTPTVHSFVVHLVSLLSHLFKSSSTCSKPSTFLRFISMLGYQRSISQQDQCVDINECANGEWASRNSSSGVGPPGGCELLSQCINTNGSFRCCSPGTPFLCILVSISDSLLIKIGSCMSSYSTNFNDFNE